MMETAKAVVFLGKKSSFHFIILENSTRKAAKKKKVQEFCKKPSYLCVQPEKQIVLFLRISFDLPELQSIAWILNFQLAANDSPNHV